MKALANIQDRLSKVESRGGGRHRRRGLGRGANGNAKPAAKDRKPCKHCGKRHMVPDNKCWTLNANKDNRPKNYVKPPPGLGGNGN